MAGDERDPQRDLSAFGPAAEPDTDTDAVTGDGPDDAEAVAAGTDTSGGDTNAESDSGGEDDFSGEDDSGSEDNSNAEDDSSGGSDSNATGDPDADARPHLADLDRVERVELGVDLLAHLERESVSLSAAVDRIETITTNPTLTREILDTAELRGVIDREEGRIRTRRGGTFVRFEEQVVRREGEYECRRCGAGLETGHFVRFEAGELGPFGPECVRKVLGRT